jgi:hypothetical protein
VKAKLALSERSYNCDSCGLVKDRDHNAALNLAALVAVTGTASGAATDQRQLVNAQGEAKFMQRCDAGVTPVPFIGHVMSTTLGQTARPHLGTGNRCRSASRANTDERK